MVYISQHAISSDTMFTLMIIALNIGVAIYISYGLLKEQMKGNKVRYIPWIAIVILSIVLAAINLYTLINGK